MPSAGSGALRLCRGLEESRNGPLGEPASGLELGTPCHIRRPHAAHGSSHAFDSDASRPRDEFGVGPREKQFSDGDRAISCREGRYRIGVGGVLPP